MTSRCWCCALAVVVALCAALSGQVQVPTRKPLRPIASIDGKALYAAYCAQCHADDGRGGGPAAAAVKTPVPDLTQIAARSGASYNRSGVARYIAGDRPGRTLDRDNRGNPVLVMDGSGLPDEMPAWGILFRAMWPDEAVYIRTGNLARYIEKMQK